MKTTFTVALKIWIVLLIALFFPANAVCFADDKTLQVTIEKESLVPIQGVNVYLFNEVGSYLGQTTISDSAGSVSFILAEGAYKVRVDYMGYQFWSPVYTLNANISETLTIPHQDVTITVAGDYPATEPIAAIPVYLFTETGSYMNKNLTTDASGQVTFNLPEKSYKVRADLRSQQYWSGAFTWLDTTVNVPMAEAEITVTGTGVSLEGVNVYAFTAAGSYLNLVTASDSSGKVFFLLPAGDYKFRADYQSSQYWSGNQTLIAGQVNPISISTGGGVLSFSVQKGASDPLVGVNCYVFSEAGSYLNLNATTDSAGLVSFNLADGNYKIRVDYLGYQFWSPVYALNANLFETLTIPHQDVIITVEGDYPTTEPIAGVQVYLFTETGSYMNQNLTTDASGQVTFSLPEKSYKVRADYRFQQFWSDAFTWSNSAVNVPMAETEITVTGAGIPLEGVNVYAFTAAGAYLNLVAASDSSGKVSFLLPAGDYKFRADYQSSQYWSETQTLIASQSNPISISTGGGVLSFSVQKGASEPLVGVNCYVFSETGSYLNLNATTDSSGLVSFNLADGIYKVRVDYMGYQFWSAVYNKLNGNISETLAIPHQDVTITVAGDYPATEPIAGIPVYLFTESGTYMNKNLTTDASGQVTFNLPEKSYKVRADYRSYQFWSNAFIWSNTTVMINHGQANIHVTRAGINVSGAKVYLFSASGSYLGWNKDTDASGSATFILPNRSFKFRVDENGDQAWSDTIEIMPGIVNTIDVVFSSADTDQDGISDTDEINIYGTSPTNPDTDGDGLSDGEELAYWGSDWNANPDNDEFINLLDYDSDNNGISDGAQANMNSFMIASTAPATATEDIEYIYNPIIFDPDSGEITFSWLIWSLSNAPAGMTVNTNSGVVTWTPLEGVTTSGQVTLSVFDFFNNVREDNETFTISVTPVNDFPKITSSAPVFGVEGVEFHYMPSVTDPDNETFVWSLSNEPKGMAIDSGTGAISWTPEEGVPSSGEVVVTVDDQNGGIDTETFIVTITTAQNIPELIFASDAGLNTNFGYSVSISGDYAIVGTSGKGSMQEAVYIFKHEGTNWVEIKKLYSDTSLSTGFGASVSIDGDFAIVGAWMDSGAAEEAGAVYIYKREGEDWIEQKKLTAKNANEQDAFGYPVSIKGGYAIIGAMGTENETGSAYILNNIDGDWLEQDQITASDKTEGVSFGYAVSISKDFAIVSSPYADANGFEGAGIAYIYKRYGGRWIELSTLASSEPVDWGMFGESVSIDDDFIIVGEYQGENGTGVAHIYKRDALNWEHKAKLEPTEQTGENWSLATVSIYDDYAMFTSPDIDGSLGAAFLFHQDGENWIEKDKKTAADREQDTCFGCSASLSENYAIIGDYGKDVTGTGNTGSGAAHIYLLEPDATKPSIQIGASKTVIEPGGSTSLIWSTLNADICVVMPGNVAVDPNGELIVSPQETTTFTVTATGPGGTLTKDIVIFVNTPPAISIVEPDGVNDNITLSAPFNISWNDSDPDDNARITIFYDTDNKGADGTLIITGLNEDPYSGETEGAFVWDTTDVPAGDYYIYAVIDDGINEPVVSYSNGVVSIINNKILASDAQADDNFGNSVSISGDYAIVGAYYDDDAGANSGSAYMFKRNGTNWVEQKKLIAGDSAEGDLFGGSVAINGNYAIVGASQSMNMGAAYIFYCDGFTWTEQIKLTASDAAVGDWFGNSVSIYGDYAIVGANYNDDAGANTGAAYIFKRDGTNWIEQAKITASDLAAMDNFGVSVSISGDYAIVGASQNNGNYGSAYIFKREGTNWIELANLTASDPTVQSYFGASVSIDGDYIIIGAYNHSNEVASYAGSAYIFKRNGTNWIEQGKLFNSNAGSYDKFATSVSIDGNYVIIGASCDDDGASGSGSAFIFKRDGVNWLEHTQLTASDAEKLDFFGGSVSIKHGFAIVGASGNDDAGLQSGAAYIYFSESFNSLLDTDSDGISDNDEYTYGTDPNDIDSDDDGINDGDELAVWGNNWNADNDNDGAINFHEAAIYGTDPNNPDSDDDKMPDGWELENGLNPAANDANGDLDGDGLLNILEYELHSNPNDSNDQTTIHKKYEYNEQGGVEECNTIIGE
ncbi:MAG: putative Ig domain-containing protein [Pseudomonadota bacterium]